MIECSVLRGDAESEGIVWLRPEHITPNVCFPLNHMRDDDREAVLNALNLKNKVVLAHPCSSPACFAGEDPEIEELRSQMWECINRRTK